MSEIELVERFKRVGFPSETALRLGSVLLWIQVAVQIPDLLNSILSLEDNVFSIVSTEVEGLLGFLLSNPVSEPSSLSVLKLQSLVDASRNDSMSITSLLGDRERIWALIDAKYMMLSKGNVRDGSSEDGEYPCADDANNGSGSSSTLASMEQSHQMHLNPTAQPFVPVMSVDGGTEDDRCLYLTFSKGHPLTSPEIVDFFTEMCNNFGGWRQNPQAVKTVYIHKGEDGMSLFGKVVFCNPYLPGFILGRQKEIKFIVNGRTLWCKRFVRRNARNNRIEHHQQGESSTQVRAPQGRVGFGGSWYGHNMGGQQFQGMGRTGRAQHVWPHDVGTSNVIGPGWPVGQFLQPTGPRVIAHVGPVAQGVVGTPGGGFVIGLPGQVGYYHNMGRGWVGR